MAMHIHPISEGKARLTCGSAEFPFGLRVGGFSVLIGLWGFMLANLVVDVSLVVLGFHVFFFLFFFFFFFFFFLLSMSFLYTFCILWGNYAFYKAFLILPINKKKIML
jgi:hypothetical protein